MTHFYAGVKIRQSLTTGLCSVYGSPFVHTLDQAHRIASLTR